MKNALPFIAAILVVVIYRALGITMLTQLSAGATVGFACGCLPFLSYKNRNPKFAGTSLWVSGFAGLLGGLLLALPVAVVMFGIGRLKSTTTPQEPQEPTVEQLP